MLGGKNLIGAAFACVALVWHLCGAPARAGSFLDAIHFGYDGSDAPGAPRSPDSLSRRLLEDGYELRAPLVQNGPVFFANVVQTGRPFCLILDAFTGTILQSFSVTAQGLRALNDDAPGPGYPGYPPFPDDRYASGCHAGAVAAAPPPLAPAPRTKPKLRIAPRRIAPRHRRRIKRKPLPACGPYRAPARPQTPVQPHDPSSPQDRPPQDSIQPEDPALPPVTAPMPEPTLGSPPTSASIAPIRESALCATPRG